MSEDQAEMNSKESARNITILRRRLSFERKQPEWALPQNVQDLVPAILLGRWDERFENDKQIISKIANCTYEEYQKKLIRWLNISDSPILRIGDTWRLASPMDSWSYAANFLTQSDFDNLANTIITIFSEVDPSLSLKPEEQFMAPVLDKERIYSDWIRQGVIQSTIIIANFGEQLEINLHEIPQVWSDSVINNLLKSDDALLWKSFEDDLPLIAEASPSALLSILEDALNSQKTFLSELFIESEGIITPISYHTGLLWALEGIAWDPEHITRAATILIELCKIDLGGRLANRPINSLTEIFKTWHPQTFLNQEGRIDVLKHLSKKHPKHAFSLLCKLLPDSHDVASGTHKFRWRFLDEDIDIRPTYREIWDTTSSIIDILISIDTHDESDLATLIEKSDNLNKPDRNKLFEFISSASLKIKTENNKLWHTLRTFLSRHRTYSKADWALSSDDLSPYQKLFKAIEPDDYIEKTFWIFEEDSPDFPEGVDHEKFSYEELDTQLFEIRCEILKNYYSNYGIQKIKELGQSSKMPWIYGDILGYVDINENDILQILETVKQDHNSKFAQAFASRKYLINGIDWLKAISHELSKIGLAPKDLSKIFFMFTQGKELWNYLDNGSDQEVRTNYWKNMTPHFYHLKPDEQKQGIEELISTKRYLTALNTCDTAKNHLPNDIIVEVLTKAATEKSDEDINITDYRVCSLFEYLDKCEDVSERTIINLEWLFLPFLSSYGKKRDPKLLLDYQVFDTN